MELPLSYFGPKLSYAVSKPTSTPFCTNFPLHHPSHVNRDSEGKMEIISLADMQQTKKPVILHVLSRLCSEKCLTFFAHFSSLAKLNMEFKFLL